MLSWKTTLAGALAALLPFIKGLVPTELGVVIDTFQAFAVAALGYFAKDKHVSGVS